MKTEAFILCYQLVSKEEKNESMLSKKKSHKSEKNSIQKKTKIIKKKKKLAMIGNGFLPKSEIARDKISYTSFNLNAFNNNSEISDQQKQAKLPKKISLVRSQSHQPKSSLTVEKGSKLLKSQKTQLKKFKSLIK